jgi:hypothetical protein
MMAGVRSLVDSQGGPDTDPYAEDRREYELYLARASQRLTQIAQASKQ